MKLNLIIAVASLIVILVLIYEIFGLGQYTWFNYLGLIFFAIVFVLEISVVLKDRKK